MASKFWQNLRDKVSNITGDAPDEARFEDYEEVIGTHTEEKPKEEPQAEPAPEASISAVSETGGNINLKFVHPTSYDMEQVSEIAELLLDGFIVVLDVEEMDKIGVMRLLDFLNGVTYVTEGTITQRSQKSFVITPKNVSITD